MFESLPGFRDFPPEVCAVRNHIFRVWRQTALRFAFQEYDAPVLEPLELFTQKSGEEIVGQLFNFVDKGGRAVALRPEMTPLLARMVGSRANALRRPIKWFNIGEQYRYEKPQKGRLRAFYQFNCDIFGIQDPSADAELIALCAHGLQSFGLGPQDFAIRLSDRTLWLIWLAGMGFEGERAAGILGVVDKMERDEPAAQVAKLKPFFGDDAPAFVQKVEKLKSLRTLEDLSAFVLEGIADAASRDRLQQRLADWHTLLGMLEALGVRDCVRIDLGVVRGLAYYTGFVFEAFESTGKGRALAGGGRYDDLVKKLGYTDLPAAGFAMGDVTVRDLLEEKGLLNVVPSMPDVFMVVGGEAERSVALQAVSALRESGISVEWPYKLQNFGKQFKAADQSGARVAVIIGSEELAAGVFKLRDLRAKAEKTVPKADLLRFVVQALEGAF